MNAIFMSISSKQHLAYSKGFFRLNDCWSLKKYINTKHGQKYCMEVTICAKVGQWRFLDIDHKRFRKFQKHPWKYIANVL